MGPGREARALWIVGGKYDAVDGGKRMSVEGRSLYAAEDYVSPKLALQSKVSISRVVHADSLSSECTADAGTGGASREQEARVLCLLFSVLCPP